MSFDLKIRFTGLCGYVPDEELGDPKKKITVMRVVMPDAQVEDKGRALDRRKLERHHPFVKFDTSLLMNPGSMVESGSVFWDIFGHELTFDITESKKANAGSNKFKVIQDFKNFGVTDKSKEDFNWGAHLKEIAPKFVRVDPRCFDDAAVKYRVAARVVIDKGRLSTNDLDPLRKFKFSTSLGGKFKKRALSNEVALDFKEIDSLTIKARPFGAQLARDLILAAASGKFEIEIGNLCGQCLFPPTKPRKPRRKDKDFRWLFEICENAEEIPVSLKNRESLPIPELVKVGKGGGLKPVECMRLNFGAYKPSALNDYERRA